ncbi:hypothetical protein Bpla01_58450 [Burkholderia plantarii]|nr:hypothetical protein Bpla01_58450 [Burkholderia plantarii]
MTGGACLQDAFAHLIRCVARQRQPVAGVGPCGGFARSAMHCIRNRMSGQISNPQNRCPYPEMGMAPNRAGGGAVAGLARRVSPS